MNELEALCKRIRGVELMVVQRGARTWCYVAAADPEVGITVKPEAEGKYSRDPRFDYEFCFRAGGETARRPDADVIRDICRLILAAEGETLDFDRVVTAVYGGGPGYTDGSSPCPFQG